MCFLKYVSSWRRIRERSGNEAPHFAMPVAFVQKIG